MSAVPSSPQPAIDFPVAEYRKDFPTLAVKIKDKDLVYLDNAATVHKPLAVINATDEYYRFTNSNIHRGVHTLSQKATQAFEAVRGKVKRFINAASEEEIIFTAGTTDSINLLAYSFSEAFIKEGDEILISQMEHHSNIVPWQIVCERKKAVLKVIPMNNSGELILDNLDSLLTERTKLVGVVHISNSLGTVNPVKEIIAAAHRKGVPVLVDGAQSVQHSKIDVQDLDCDFFAFSGHKLYGPTGTGVLYGKKSLLNQLPPFRGGGDMILKVTFEKTTYNVLPNKFEAGTPNIAGVIGLGAAIDYLSAIGMDAIHAYETELLKYATEKISEIEGVKLIGTAAQKSGALAFVLENVHPHDIGTILDFEGVAIRAGHHCTQPVMDFYGVPATARASFSFYNTFEEIDRLCEAVRKVFEVMG